MCGSNASHCTMQSFWIIKFTVMSRYEAGILHFKSIRNKIPTLKSEILWTKGKAPALGTFRGRKKKNGISRKKVQTACLDVKIIWGLCWCTVLYMLLSVVVLSLGCDLGCNQSNVANYESPFSSTSALGRVGSKASDDSALFWPPVCLSVNTYLQEQDTLL